MEDARLSDTRFYNVLERRSISLQVTVGDRQVGGTAITLNGVPLPFNPVGETPIGQPGQDLRRSVLQVVTTVKDQNELTNRTSVRHELNGGAVNQVFDFAVSVNADGGLARYFITYVLL